MTLLEVIVAAALTGLLLLLLGSALRSTERVFRTITGTSDASLELRRAGIRLRSDVLGCSRSQMLFDTAPAGAGVPEGSAVCMLSNLDPATGLPVYRSDGSPLWTRNIVYYLAAPANHQAVFGSTCTTAAGPGGLDDRCPHKVLIRKVIAMQTVHDEDHPEQILTSSQLATFLTRPTGYSSASIREANVSSVELVSRNLLFFRAGLLQDRVTFDVRAVSLAPARTSLAIGTVSLYDSVYTHPLLLAIPPQVL